MNDDGDTHHLDYDDDGGDCHLCYYDDGDDYFRKEVEHLDNLCNLCHQNFERMILVCLLFLYTKDT